MKNYQIFVVNPGSTSTKVALFKGDKVLFEANIPHDAAELSRFAQVKEQLPYRIETIEWALAAQGVAVLFASSDLPEVLGVADRIVVMREGEIAGELLHEQADERQALSLAMPKVSQAVA